MSIVRDMLSSSIGFIREEIMPLRTELIKAGILTPQQTAFEQKASLVDPWAYGSVSQGYKEKYSLLDYSKCRQITYADPIVAAVLQTRLNQVAAFAQLQADKYKMGFKIVLRDHEKVPTGQEKKRIKEIEQFIQHCGVPENFEDTPELKRRDSFELFLRKVARDSLTFDQVNFEITPRRDGKPYAFTAIDAATIRVIPDKKEETERYQAPNVMPLIDATTTSDSEKFFRVFKPKHPRYAQVINGVIQHVFDEWEMAFGVRNPRTDILSYGYGFCLHPDSRVATTRGMVRISELAESEGFEVVIDGKTSKAKAFKTGNNRIFELRMKDGRILKASPDHQIYSLSDSGEFGWKRLSEIKSGDVVACDLAGQAGGIKSFEFQFHPGDKQRSKEWEIESFEEDIWEVLGWLVGDGNFREKHGSQKGISTSLFYERKVEESIMRRHLDILGKYNLPVNVYEGRDDIYEVKFNHQGFGEWLRSLGFIPSNGWTKPNCLPEVVFFLQERDRASFLRGLFSADGHLGASDTPHLGCTDKGLLQDTQRLLWSMGMRSHYYHGKVAKDLGCGEKEYDDGKLWVYDKVKFFEKIGFIQDHKQPVLDTYRGTRADVVGESFGRRAALEIKVSGKEDRRIRGLIESPARWGVTRSWLKERLPESSQSLKDLHWHHGVVGSVVDTGDEIEMYDVSVENDFHAFVVDGIVVHNSEIEMLVTTITSHMNAETYNRKFFSQGSSIKGILTFEGAVPPDQLEAFRRQWYQQVTGVNNAWRTPIMGLGKDSKLNWTSLHSTNREMEFGKWLEYCIKVICGVFQIDPIEIGFDISKQGSGQQSSSGGLGQGNQAERVSFSQDRGLRPLLIFIQQLLNDYIVYRIDPNYEFRFVGLNVNSEKDDLEQAVQQVKSFKTINEIRAEHDLEPLPAFDKIKNPGEVVLDSSLIQFITGQMQAAQQQAGVGPDGQPLPPGQGGAPGDPSQAGGDQDPNQPQDEGEGDQEEEPDYESMDVEQLQQEYNKLKEPQSPGEPAMAPAKGKAMTKKSFFREIEL